MVENDNEQWENVNEREREKEEWEEKKERNRVWVNGRMTEKKGMDERGREVKSRGNKKDKSE